jgi:DNA-binding IclR family transcriptional regulator
MCALGTATEDGAEAPEGRPGAPLRGRATHLVQSADHALQLLRAVAARGSLRVAEAAQLLDVVPSTAHRLLTTLGHQGFVVQERRGGAYLPGPAIVELAGATSHRLDLRSAARPALEWLREQTGETASLLVLDGVDVRFVDSIDGSRTVRVSARTGVVLPAHCTSGGKALLATLSTEELQRLYPDGRLVPYSPRSISEWSRLEVELEEVRRRGYATNFDEGDAGIGGVGVAVWRADHKSAVAAICLAAPIARLRTRKAAAAHVPALCSARDQLEATLAGGLVQHRGGSDDHLAAPMTERIDPAISGRQMRRSPR